MLLAAAPSCAEDLASPVTFGGNLALTTDDIYRGVSESDGQAALQADLHADADGTFLGVWASTRKRSLYPYADYDVEAYLGHRFELTSSWGATLEARSRYFVGGAQPESADYQQISGSLTYLDRWTLSLTAIPNAVRYWYFLRLTRGPAYVAETSAQWLIKGGFFLTAGAGYYYSTGRFPDYPAGFEGMEGMASRPLGGYAYGNLGAAFEYGRWRLDVGYYLTEQEARELTPYPSARERVAGTLTWRF